MSRRRGSFELLIFTAICVLLGFFFIIGGLPNDKPVKCGDEIMTQDEYCGYGRPVSLDGSTPQSNYDSLASEQHAAHPGEIALGVAAVAIGAGGLVLDIYLRRRTARGPVRYQPPQA